MGTPVGSHGWATKDRHRTGLLTEPGKSECFGSRSLSPAAARVRQCGGAVHRRWAWLDGTAQRQLQVSDDGGIA
jgi:hypothetical protein